MTRQPLKKLYMEKLKKIRMNYEIEKEHITYLKQKEARIRIK